MSSVSYAPPRQARAGDKWPAPCLQMDQQEMARVKALPAFLETSARLIVLSFEGPDSRKTLCLDHEEAEGRCATTEQHAGSEAELRRGP